LLDGMGVRRIFGAWTRGLAKSCGADDGLWQTYPDLAAGLARQRLEYARSLGARLIVTSSPLCASFLTRHQGQADPPVAWLPEFVLEKEVVS
jgi:Fe-S oxidoreductase